MSEVIDSRIVEMRFDNSQFESNVRESMKTIDNLKSSLDFEDSIKGLEKIKVDIDASGAVHGLQAISDAAGDCDLSQISDSAKSVELSFSALEIVAVTALGKITSAAIDAGAKAAKAFAIQPVTDGFAEYNQQLKSTRVIVSNTGQELSEVTRILDDLNEYADKTIYSFGDMTQAMGYFTSALGEQSAESAAVIAKGISNWAASTGQGNEVAKRIMYQVSQGLSTGSFRLMDWKSIENTGAMAGKVYQEYFIDTAKEVYKKSTDEILVNKKGEAASFRDSLQTGWLTNEVFLKTMEKFANINGDFQWMEDAATKILTFSDLLDTVREQLGTGWGDSWKIVFGTYEQSIKFFTGISDRISHFIDTVNKARNAILQTWSDKGGRALLFGVSEEDVGAVGKLLDGILELLSQVHEAFLDAFGSDFISDLLLGATKAVSDFANAFERLSHLTIVHDLIRSVLTILKSIFSIIGDIYKIVEPFLSLALQGVEKILSALSKVTETAANLIDKVAVKFSSLAEKITAPFQTASNFIANIFGGVLDSVSGKISSMWGFLKQFDVLGIMGNVNTSLVGDIADQKSIAVVNKELNNTVGKIKEVDKAVKEATKTTENLGDQWWDLISEDVKNQYFAPELWSQLSDEQREAWRKHAEQNELYNTEEYIALSKNAGKSKEIFESTEGTNKSLEKSYNSAIKIGESVSITGTDLEKADKTIKDISKDVEKVNESLEKTPSNVTISLSLGDAKAQEAVEDWWDLISEEDRNQYFAPELWDELNDEQRAYWKKRAIEFKLIDKAASDSNDLSDSIEKVNDTLQETEKQAHDVTNTWWDLISEEDKKQYFAPELWSQLNEEQREAWRKHAEQNELFNTKEYEALKREAETSGSYDWWDLISESDKSKHFVADYWDELTDKQKEHWKQYALELGLFTDEELRLLENTEKTVNDILHDRDTVIQKKRDEADLWWDLIDEDKKKQYFMGEYWDVLTDKQRESWRKRAEEYKLYDPEEYARLLGEMAASEEAAFSPETVEEIAESTDAIGSWFDKASKIPIIGGFLKDFGWLTTKVVKNTKSFAGAVGKSFGGFFDYVKELNGTDLTFFEKFNYASSYFKENVSDYLGELVLKNFRTVGNAISNTEIVSKLNSFTSSVKDRFLDFKSYVKDINTNTELTFPEKFKASFDYFNTNVLGFIGSQIGNKFREISDNISNNKIVTNLVSLGNATKSKFEEFKSYVTDLNNNTELTFPEKFSKTLEFFKTNVIDYFLELINKNLKSVGIDIEKIGKEISDALNNAANFILDTLRVFGVDTETIRKFFWNDDGTLKSIPEIITQLGDEIEQALNNAKAKLLAAYEQFFPSTEEGKLTGPLGWLVSAKEKIDGFVDSIFGSSEKLGKAQKETSGNGLFTAALGVLGLTGGSSIMKTVGNVNSLFSFGKNIGIAGKVDFGKIAIGVAVAAGAFGLLSKIDFTKLGIDFSVFTKYFKDGEGNLLPIPDIIDKINTSISKSAIGQWVGSTAQLIGRNFSTAFDLLHEKTVFFSEFLKVLNETDLPFPQKFSYAFRFFKEQFVIPFGQLAKQNLKTIGIDLDSFFSKFKNDEGKWLSVGDVITKVGDKISTSIEEQKKKFEQTSVGKWITEKIETFKAAHPQLMTWLESVEKGVSDVFTWIGDTSKLIGKNIGSAFTIFGEQFGIFKGHIRELNDNTELTFPEKFKAVLKLFKEDFIKPFGEIAKRNLKTIGIDLDAFVNYFKDNEGNWMSIGDIITKVGNSIHDAFDDLKKKFEQSKFGQWISKKFSDISEWFDNFTTNLQKFAGPLLGGAGFIFLLTRISKMFDFITSIGRILSGRTPEAEAQAFATGAQALAGVVRDVASAVMMIAIALGGLSLLDQDELERASNSINNVIKTVSVLTGIFAAMSFFSSKKKIANSGALALLEVAGSIMLIATAFKLITTIELGWDLIGHFLILGVLMAAVVALGKYAQGIKGGKDSFIGMIGVATAMIEMVGALYLVQLMIESHSGVGWALLTLLGLVGTLALVCAAAKSVKWQSGLGLILMAYSLRTMVDSLEYLFESDLFDKFKDNLGENIVKLFGVLAILYALAEANKLAGGGKAGLSMISIAASVWALAKAIEVIAEIPSDKILPAVAVVSWLTIVMGAILTAYSHWGGSASASFRGMIVTTANIYAVVIAVLMLCTAVVLLSAIDQTNLKTAAGVVGGLTIVVGAIAVAMAALSSRWSDVGKTLGILTAAVLVAAAMGALIWALDRYIPDKSNLKTIVESVSLLTGLVGAMAVVFGKLDLYFGSSAYLGELAIVLAEMVGVVTLVGLALSAMANLIPSDSTWDRLSSIVGAVSILAAVVTGMTIAFGLIKLEGIKDWSKLGALAVALLEAVAVITLIGLALSAMANLMPKDIDTGHLLGIVGAVSILAGVATALTAVLGNIHIDLKSAGKGALAILMIGGVLEVLFAGMALIVGLQKNNDADRAVTVVERLGKGLAKFFDSIMTTISKLNWSQLLVLFLAVAAVIAALAVAGLEIGAGIVIFGAAMGVFGIEMAVAAAAIVGILDLTLPWFDKFANEGVPIFEKIAEGIIKIATIIIDGIVANVESIIEVLRDFNNFAVKDFDAEKTGQAVAVAGQLAEVIGAFVGDDFLGMLGKFIGEKLFGEANRNAFIRNIGCLTGVLSAFKTEVSTWSAIDLGKSIIAANLAQQLTDIANSFTDTNLLTAFGKFIGEKLFGATNRASFTENMKTVGEALRTFVTEINSIENFDEAKATDAITVANKMIDLVNKFEPQNFWDALSKWASSKIIDPETQTNTFLASITNLSTAVTTFCEQVDTWVLPNDYESKIGVADKMIELIKKMPSLEEISGLMTMDSFGTSIENFSASFKTAMVSLNEALSSSQIENYDEKIAVINQLIEMSKILPEAKSAIGVLFGVSNQKDFQDFGKDIEAFSDCLVKFATNMNLVPSLKDWDTNKGVITDLIELAGLLPKDNSWISDTLFGSDINTDFKKFGTDVEAFVESFDTAVTKINGMPITEGTHSKFEQMKALVGSLITMSNDLPKSVSTADTTGKSGEIVTTMSQTLSEFMKGIVGDADFELIDLDGTKKYSNSIFDLYNLIVEKINSLKTLNESGIAAFESLTSESGILKRFAGLTDSLPEVSKDSTTLTTFGNDIYNLAESLWNSFYKLKGLGQSGGEGDSAFAFDVKPLEDLGTGLGKIVTAFSGLTPEQLQGVSDIIGGVDSIAENGKSITGGFFGNLVGSLFSVSGKIGKATTSASGVLGILGTLGGDNGIGKLLGGLLPEGGIDTSGITDVFGTSNADGTVSGGIISTITDSISQINENFGKNGNINISDAAKNLTTMFSTENFGEFDFSGIEELCGTYGNGEFAGDGFLDAVLNSLNGFNDNFTGENGIDFTVASTAIASVPSEIMPASYDFSASEPLLGVYTPGQGFDNTGFLSMLSGEIRKHLDAIGTTIPESVASANAVLADLVNGMSVAGSVTPELAVNFNETMNAFATNGIKAYTDVFNSNETEIKLNNVAKTIVNKTGAGIDSALKVTTNKIRLAAKAAVKLITDIISGDSTNPYAVSGPLILDKTANGITSALSNPSSLLDTSCRSVVNFITGIFSGESDNPYANIGSSILDKTANGISSALNGSAFSLDTSCRSVVSYVANILSASSEYPNPYTSAGESVITGFISGMSDTGSVYNAAWNVGRRAVQGLKDAIDSNSPSKEAEYYGGTINDGLVGGVEKAADNYDKAVEKVEERLEDTNTVFVTGYASMLADMDNVIYVHGQDVGNKALSGLANSIRSASPSKAAMEYGQYFSEGFMIGIDSYGKAVEAASENVGNEALFGLGNYINKVYDLLDSGLELNPVITPVLDLSEIQNGVNSVDALFSRQQAYSTNMEVNGAIRARANSSKIVSTTDYSRNFGEITFNIYTQSSNNADDVARRISEEISRKLKTI